MLFAILSGPVAFRLKKDLAQITSPWIQFISFINFVDSIVLEIELN